MSAILQFTIQTDGGEQSSVCSLTFLCHQLWFTMEVWYWHVHWLNYSVCQSIGCYLGEIQFLSPNLSIIQGQWRHGHPYSPSWSCSHHTQNPQSKEVNRKWGRRVVTHISFWRMLLMHDVRFASFLACWKPENPNFNNCFSGQESANYHCCGCWLETLSVKQKLNVQCPCLIFNILILEVTTRARVTL